MSDDNEDLKYFIEKLFLQGMIRDEIVDKVVEERKIQINEACAIVDKVYSRRVKKNKEYKKILKEKNVRNLKPQWAIDTLNNLTSSPTGGLGTLMYNIYFTKEFFVGHCINFSPLTVHQDYYLTFIKNLENKSPDEILPLNRHNFKFYYDEIDKVILKKNSFKFVFKNRSIFEKILKPIPKFYSFLVYEEKEINLRKSLLAKYFKEIIQY